MTIIRRSLVPIIVGAILCMAAAFNAGTAHAQCATVVVTNNLSCNLRLCLFSATGAAPVCFDIPAGPPTVVSFPAGFVPVGALSSAGNAYLFGANGCTKCFAQITSHAVICCGVVCYDPASCSIAIGQCTTPVCNP